MTPPSLPISESAATHFLTADLRIGSITVLNCRPLNWQRRISWLLISESATTQFLDADFRIGSDIDLDCQFLTQFLLLISESTAM